MNKILIATLFLVIINSQMNIISQASLNPNVKNNRNIQLASSNSKNTIAQFGSTSDLSSLSSISIDPPKIPKPAAKADTLPTNPTSSTSGSASWISAPTATAKFIPAFIKYKMTFCLQCLQTPLYIYVGVWPNTPFSAYITNLQTGSSYLLSFNQGLAIVNQDIVKKLSCGCDNVLTIIQWNTQWGWAWASIQQSSQCKRCDNDYLGFTFFNKDTCRCQCKCGSLKECSGKNQNWSDYPKCTCSCRQSLICQPNFEFSYTSCGCECYKKCYPWQTLNSLTCTCN